MRINKFISESGMCSRREADRLIQGNRVKINGQIAQIVDTVCDEDLVEVDDSIIKRKIKSIYIVLNKPVGITSTTDREIKGNIVDFVNHEERIFHIGRLDKDSEGLILLTNNGDIVNQILRAENNHEKEYIVTVNKKITDEFINNMSNGVKILGVVTKSCKVIKLNDRMFKIILTQGLNRQIRRMCSIFDYKVIKLQRIRIMNISIGDLNIGQWRYLKDQELEQLMKILDDSK